MIQLKNATRDVRIARDTEAMYLELMRILNIEARSEIFTLAVKYALFKELEPKKLSNAMTFLRVDNLEKERQADVEALIAITFARTKDPDILAKGTLVQNHAQELANAGIRLLHKTFTEDGKDEIYVLEDIVAEIKKNLLRK